MSEGSGSSSDDGGIRDSLDSGSSGSGSGSSTGSTTETTSGSTWDEEEEQEALLAMAEQAKEDIRRQLRELRAVYRSIKQRNLEIPDKFRISEEALKLPKEIYEGTFNKILQDCDEAYRVNEYESAETLIQLDKLQKHFFDPIQTLHIVVKDITHELQVHTIRDRKTSPEFEELLSRNLALISEESRIRLERTGQSEMTVKAESAQVKRVWAEDLIGEYKSKMDILKVETQRNIKHLEKRLEQKFERECAWAELMEKKIPLDYIPPEDLELLNRAKNNTGAYQLQTADTYPPPQITIAERRQKIIDVKLQMRNQITEFNRQVIAARDEKPKVIGECRRLEKEIRKVHVLLPEEYRRKVPPIFDMDAEETPETFFDITEADVEAEEQAMLAAAGLQHIADEINEDFFGVKKPEPSLPIEEADLMPPPPAPTARAARQAKTVDLEFETVSSHRCRKVQFNGESEGEKKRFWVQFYPRLYRQELLFKEFDRVVNYFHERIKYLHDKRVRLELEGKIKTIALLTMIAELEIAKDFAGQELALAEILRVQKTENKITKKYLDKLKKKLLGINTQMKKAEDELMFLNREVDRAIGEKSKFKEFLWKVFSKDVPVPGHEEDFEELPVDEESKKIKLEDGDTDRSDQYKKALSQMTKHWGKGAPVLTEEHLKAAKKQAIFLDLDVCPEHLDRLIYERMVELRAKRVTIQYEMGKNKEAGELLTEEFTDVEAKFFKVQERLKELAEETRVLQRRRQKRMNDLKVLIILRVDQIQCMDLDELAEMEGEVLEKLAASFPSSSSVLIFPKGGTAILEARADELAKNGQVELDKLKRGKSMLLRLHQEYRKAEEEVEGLKEKVKTEMTLKFGEEIDLDEITASLIDLELEEKESELATLITENYREREAMDKQLQELKYQLTKAVEENSRVNMLHAAMLERRRDLEYYIWRNETDAKEEAGQQGEGDGPSEPRPPGTHFSYEKLEEDICSAKGILEKQGKKMEELKGILSRCRTKSGMPPLIKTTKPLCTEPCGYTPTAQEIAEANEGCVDVRMMDIQCPEKAQPTPRWMTLPPISDDPLYLNFDELDKYGTDEEEEVTEESLEGEEEDLPLPPTNLSKSDIHSSDHHKATKVKLDSQKLQSSSGDHSSEKDKRAKSKKASRKTILLIAEKARTATEEDVMGLIHRYSMEDPHENEDEELESIVGMSTSTNIKVHTPIVSKVYLPPKEDENDKKKQ